MLLTNVISDIQAGQQILEIFSVCGDPSKTVSLNPILIKVSDQTKNIFCIVLQEVTKEEMKESSWVMPPVMKRKWIQSFFVALQSYKAGKGKVMEGVSILTFALILIILPLNTLYALSKIASNFLQKMVCRNFCPDFLLIVQS